MHRRHVQRIVAAANPQEARRLFERLRPEARHRHQFHPRAETPVLVAVLHDLQRGPLRDPRHIAQQGPRRGVEVHPHAVHAALHRRLQALLQAPLIHVVLVLPHADRFRVHLHQFRQRILQAPRDGNRPAHRQVQIRELLPRHLRRRVYRSARLAHRHAENLRQIRLPQEVLHQRRRFARRRPVADGDRLHVVPRHQRGQRLDRSREIVPRLERVDHRIFQKLAGIVHYGDLAAGANPRVERQHRHPSRRRREQQVLQVLAKYLDGLFVGAVLQLQAHFGLDGGIQQPVVGILDRPLQVRHPVARLAHHPRAQPRLRLLRVQNDFKGQHTFLGAAPDGQHAMRRYLRRRLAVTGVHFELAFRIHHAFDGAALHPALGHHHGAHRLAKLGVLADHFGDDVPRAFERLFRRHAEPRRHLRQWSRIVLLPQKKRQRLQPLVARHRRLGAPLRLVRQIEVFQFGLFQRRLDLRLQFRGEFALFPDRREYRLAPVFQFAEILQLLLDLADLHLVQIARGLLAIARNERHGGSPVEQFHHRQHPLQWDAQQFRDMHQYGGGECLQLSHDLRELL